MVHAIEKVGALMSISTRANISSSHTEHRGGLATRILWIIGSIVCVFAVGVCGFNLMAARIYNTATEQLNNAIAEYSTTNPDLAALATSQVSTDNLFSRASSLSWMKIPGLQSSIAHNQKLSAQLTKQIEEDLKKKDSSSSTDNNQVSSSPDSSNSSGSSGQSDNPSTTLDEDTQERMKTLLAQNAGANNSVEPQAPPTKTKKPW